MWNMLKYNDWEKDIETLHFPKIMLAIININLLYEIIKKQVNLMTTFPSNKYPEWLFNIYFSVII